MQVMSYEGEPPQRQGRRSLYPLDTMQVGTFFFVEGRTQNNLASYVSERGRKLGRRFATRLQWMKLVDGQWQVATEGQKGAVQGIAVYRTG